jgi:DNA-binding NtrC family response regulator
LPIGGVTTGVAILLYEDDALCAQSFAAVLRSAGHTVQITNHFMPALAALEAGLPIDALLTDVAVPDGGVNRMALARMALVKRPVLKVIYFTGYESVRAGRPSLRPHSAKACIE